MIDKIFNKKIYKIKIKNFKKNCSFLSKNL